MMRPPSCWSSSWSPYVAGMIPPGAKDFDPKLHAIHRLTAVHRGGAYRVALFQNTPARFDGRPQEVEQMTADLRAAQK